MSSVILTLGRGAACACVVLGSSGCFWAPKSDQERLEREVSDQHKRLTALERKSAERFDNTEGKAADIEKSVDDARRGQADMVAKMSELEEHMAKLEGQLAEYKREKELSAKPKPPADEFQGLDPNTMSPSEVFTQGKKAFDANNQVLARSLFKQVLVKAPTDAQADDAIYWTGMSYLAQERPATALTEFRKILEAYPSSDLIDVTLLRMSESYLKLRSCPDAKQTLEILIKRKPPAATLKMAREQLQNVSRNSKALCGY